MLPQKLFFRIGEVSGLVGVEPHVLRYWEREFRSIRPTKSAKGQRVYSRRDVENLLRVRDLLYRDGFTIAGAKKKLLRGAPPVLDASSDDDDDAQAEDRASAEEALRTESPRDGGVPAPRPDRAVSAHTEALPVLRPTQSDVAPAPALREKLVELRGEVEAFLAELSSGVRR